METLSCPVWSLSWCNNGSFHRTEIIESLPGPGPGCLTGYWPSLVIADAEVQSVITSDISPLSPCHCGHWGHTLYIQSSQSQASSIELKLCHLFTPASHHPLPPILQTISHLWGHVPNCNELCINGSEGIGAAFVKTFPPFVVNCIVRRILY